MQKKARAQGTIEYLVIIGIIIIISLVVVGILTGFLETSTKTTSTSKELSLLTGEFSISNALVTNDGNFNLTLKNNNDQKTITYVEIVDENNQNFSYNLAQSQAQNFMVYSNNNCTENTRLTKTIKIKYKTKFNLEKTEIIEDVPFECVNYQVKDSANNSQTTTPTQETYPQISLLTPTNNNIHNASSIDFTFSLTNASSTENCYLILNNNSINSITNLIEGDNTFSSVGISSYTLDTNHTWDVNCNKSDTNYSSTNGFFKILHPSIYLSSSNTGNFSSDENLIANINPNYDDQNTYWFKWFKGNELIATNILNENTTNYYPFDNDTKDYFSNKDGINTNATNINGKINKGLSFNGSNSVVTLTGDYRTPLEFVKLDNSVPANTDTTSTNGRIGQGTSSSKSDYYYIFGGTVVYDENEPNTDHKYKMYYFGTHSSDGGYRVIMRATSPDGLTWTKTDNSIPAQSDTTSTNGRLGRGTNSSKGDYSLISNPTIIIDDGNYKMWYNAYNYSGASKWTVYHATSDDNGLTWTKYDNIETTSCDTVCEGNGKVGAGTSGGDTGGISSPVVLKVDGEYKMWYGGHDGTNWKIYYATSSNGLTWTKYNKDINSSTQDTGEISNNGKLLLGSTGQGDNLHVMPGSVIYEDGLYRMWYKGYDGSYWGFFQAVSTNGLNWIKVNNDPLSASDIGSTLGRLPRGTTGGDAPKLTGVSVLHIDNTYHMWYGGQRGAYTGEIYYASAPENSLSFWAKPNEENWKHIVNSNGIIYENGEISFPSNYPIYSTTNETTIGKTSASTYFNGIIDEFAIYSSSLTQEQILQLYHGGLNDGNNLSSELLTTGENWKVGYQSNYNDEGWSEDINSQPVTIT